MKYTEKIYKVVTYQELRKVITKYFKLRKQWSIPYDLGLRNNSYTVLSVNKENEVEELEEDYSTYDYLTLLARNRVIEEGEYLLEVSW